MKASGLAAGKGVVVASSRSEACSAVHSMLTEHKFGSSGSTVVVEELLEGEEVSVSAWFDTVLRFKILTVIPINIIDFCSKGRGMFPRNIHIHL